MYFLYVLICFLSYWPVWQALNPPASPIPTSPLRFGILGAANIAPIALISPASNHPETIVYAVAARDPKKAEAYAKKYAIGKVYSGPTGYQSTRITLQYRSYI